MTVADDDFDDAEYRALIAQAEARRETALAERAYTEARDAFAADPTDEEAKAAYKEAGASLVDHRAAKREESTDSPVASVEAGSSIPTPTIVAEQNFEEN